MSRWFPSPVERAVDLPAFCGRCGRPMKHTFRGTGFDRQTGHPNPVMPTAECPKWDGDPGDHEAFIVSPRPSPTMKGQQTPRL